MLLLLLLLLLNTLKTRLKSAVFMQHAVFICLLLEYIFAVLFCSSETKETQESGTKEAEDVKNC